MKNEERKNRLWAVAATVVFHVALCLLMLYSFLTYTPQAEPEPPLAKTDILFGGEYVVLGDMPYSDMNGEGILAAASDETAVAGDDAENAGAEGEGAAAVTLDEESTMKTGKKKNGPTEAELAEQERIAREQQKQRNESRKINSNVKNAFTRQSGDEGRSGSTDGNATHGALAGKPGHSLGAGYTLSDWGKPASSLDGELVIQVRVNKNGQVISARYISGKGAAAASNAVRRSCEQASLKSRFSVPKNATGDKVGTIIWRFE